MRANSIISRILVMKESEAEFSLNQILREFAKRHRNITKIFENNYNRVRDTVEKISGKIPDISGTKRLLIGSFFTMEYSIESAALFNPSIVEHPDQSGLIEGQKRFIVSLRATGESHISSIVFRSGIIDRDNNILLDPQGNYISEAEIIKGHIYDKKTFLSVLKEHNIHNHISTEVFDALNDTFYYGDLKTTVDKIKSSKKLSLEDSRTINQIMWFAKSHYEILFSQDTDISERVIFPSSRTESNGIEDARFVKFTDDNGDVCYYATYTAFDGWTILPKILETKDFYHFKNMPMHGECVRDKNFALFPRKIDGKYVMISRIDGINQYIMFSDNMGIWESAQLLDTPKYDWEFIQVGNCGSPVELDEGWLVITHGVGPMRKYCLGAILLDKRNPTKVLGKLNEPLIAPNEDEREGYVPNVVYSCGAMKHNTELIISYAVSDYSSSFATICIEKLLAAII
jgi:predicted GH43/DUF377 family glycosyl hydrolase